MRPELAPPPTLPSDGGASLLSFLAMAIPLLVVVAGAFWAWPHIARALRGVGPAGNDTLDPADAAAEPAATPEGDTAYRVATLPGGLDFSLYRETTDHPDD
jgi:hypothetical protein